MPRPRRLCPSVPLSPPRSSFPTMFLFTVGFRGNLIQVSTCLAAHLLEHFSDYRFEHLVNILARLGARFEEWDAQEQRLGQHLALESRDLPPCRRGLVLVAGSRFDPGQEARTRAPRPPGRQDCRSRSSSRSDCISGTGLGFVQEGQAAVAHWRGAWCGPSGSAGWRTAVSSLEAHRAGHCRPRERAAGVRGELPGTRIPAHQRRAPGGLGRAQGREIVVDPTLPVQGCTRLRSSTSASCSTASLLRSI